MGKFRPYNLWERNQISLKRTTEMVVKRISCCFAPARSILFNKLLCDIERHVDVLSSIQIFGDATQCLLFVA